MRRAAGWLFEGRDPAAGWWDVIVWWEKRRIAYNLIVGVVGVVSLLVFFAAIELAGGVGPGEDAVEPLALIAAPVLLNVAYTAGWMAEVLVRLVYPGVPRRFGPVLLGMGLGVTVVVEVLPAVVWVGVAVEGMVV